MMVNVPIKQHPNRWQYTEQLRALDEQLRAIDGLVTVLRDNPNQYQQAEYLKALRVRVLAQGGTMAPLKKNPNTGQMVAGLRELTVQIANVVSQDGEDEGGGDYEPSYVLFDGVAYLRRSDPLDGVAVADQGFIRCLVVPDAEGAVLLRENSASVFFHVDPAGRFNVEMFGNEGGFTAFADGVVIDAVSDILFAWDVGLGEGLKRTALYVNDTLIPLTIDDDFGSTVDLEWSDFNAIDVCSTAIAPAATKYADVGMWLGSTIVEADNTITELNRRKFIDGSGNPVDPTNWPASPLIKFSGNAAAFVTNQGSGGAFVLAGGSISDTTP